jgi:hypothetical protein
MRNSSLAKIGEDKAKMLHSHDGKRVLLVAAAILAARKLAQFDGGRRVPATVAAISDAVRWAEELMKAIDERWPTKSKV